MWGKREDMLVHEDSPYNAEPAGSALVEGEVTALDTFYCRNHGEIPDIPGEQWRLSVTGLVDHGQDFTLSDLESRFETHGLVATLQCAGNRRAGLIAVRDIPGEPWESGATSTAEWRGVRLSDVLEACGVHTARSLHVEFTAPDVADEATPPQQYGSSIPLSKALSDEVLLVWEMNSEPLPRVHGGPVRVVVPGYIGARSVKWITGINVQDHPSDNYFQTTAYHILPADADLHTARPGDGIPLSTVALNCDILDPSDGATVSSGPLTIRGYALAGDGRGIARVDVSLDGGHAWAQAELDAGQSPWHWRRWSLAVDAKPGPLTITARAWDTTAAVQPESAAQLWNPHGYVNNSWPTANLTVT
ncbi:sulfite oxidase [Rhodococcus marinonascens]|uniref:sulfite oxidase n=1 Tax=Rhodococcus marinonascens TaxID=38311 RepID=UPI000934167F|nr:sulfite oxidase [Rhodococcus marinonascens]